MALHEPTVFVTRRIPDAALRIVQTAADTRVWPGDLPPEPDRLRAACAGVEGIYCLLTDRIDAGLLAAVPKLRVVSTMSVGYDHIDVAACRARQIAVGHTPGVLDEATADLAFALLMACARRIVEADRYTRSGEWRTWSPDLLTGADVHGAALGIVGLGRIGRAVARRAAGFGMTPLYTARSPHPDAESLGARFCALEALLRASDFVSLHVPLTDRTRGMIGAPELALMKPTAYLINTSRGQVVDTTALCQSLESGRIAGAGIDVYETEPVAPDHPLLRLPNVTALPHIGSATGPTRTRMACMAAENLVAGLAGRPLPHPVPA